MSVGAVVETPLLISMALVVALFVADTRTSLSRHASLVADQRSPAALKLARFATWIRTFLFIAVAVFVVRGDFAAFVLFSAGILWHALAQARSQHRGESSSFATGHQLAVASIYSIPLAALYWLQHA